MSEERTNFLTTRQLARMWRVSEATIKRWADKGSLHPTKTLGGHRRFALSEVLRFQNTHGLDVDLQARKAARLSALPDEREPVDETEAQQQFFEAITRGQEGAAAAVLLGAYMKGMPLVKILDVTIAGAMRRVGESWHCGELSVADEHFSTQTATRAIETLRGCVGREQTAQRRALTCAVEEELHEVATLCVEVLLQDAGWLVTNLGANTPFYAMTDAVERHEPHMVCVSSTANMALSRNAREYDQFRAAAERASVRLVLGGEGFRDEVIRQRFPADLHAESFNDLLKFLPRL